MALATASMYEVPSILPSSMYLPQNDTAWKFSSSGLKVITVRCALPAPSSLRALRTIMSFPSTLSTRTSSVNSLNAVPSASKQG